MRSKQGNDNMLFGALFRKPLNREQYMGARGFKNFFMLSVRISSDGCTRKVWRARKMRKSALHTVKSMGKFFYNRATTRICAKKPFIVIECSCDCFGFGKFPINNCVLYSLG